MSTPGFLSRLTAPLFSDWRRARRAQYKAEADAWEEYNKAQSTYRGGVSNRTSSPWAVGASKSGGTSAMRTSARSMMWRARDVYRENPIARSLLNTETDNVIAEGLTLQARSSDSAFNEECEERWYEWLQRADMLGGMSGCELMRLSWRQPRLDGDGGFILAQDRFGQSRLQYVPSDWICSPWGQTSGRTKRGTYLFDGVETDLAGVPITFHVRDEDEFGKRKFTPIPAEDFVYLPHMADDPLQVRGATCFATIFSLLDQLEGYIDAAVVAARMHAAFGLIFKSRSASKEYNSLPIGGLLGTQKDSQGSDRRAVTIESGMIKYVAPEDEVATVTPTQPIQGADNFIRAIFRLICVPFDMPLEIGMKDLSQVNFSGGRIGLLGYYRSCRVKQEYLMSRCWSRVFRWWVSRERKRQEFGFATAFRNRFPADYAVHTFLCREWDYTDPVSEANADLIEISAGWKAPQQAIMARGRDPEEVRRLMKEWRERNAADGIPNVLSNSTRDETAKVTAVDANGNPVANDEASFKRDILKSLLAVPAAREAVYNATNIEDLVTQAGLTPEKGYEAPFIPVVAGSGPLVSGATITDPDGDVVGGDVENTLPAEEAGRNMPPGGNPEAT